MCFPCCHIIAGKQQVANLWSDSEQYRAARCPIYVGQRSIFYLLSHILIVLFSRKQKTLQDGHFPEVYHRLMEADTSAITAVFVIPGQSHVLLQVDQLPPVVKTAGVQIQVEHGRS